MLLQQIDKAVQHGGKMEMRVKLRHCADGFQAVADRMI
jgi:hypothetical protein